MGKTLLPTPSIRAGLVSALVLAALLLSRGACAQGSTEGRMREGYRYSSKVSPERPKVGDLAIVEIRLEGVAASSASVLELKLEPGLELEAESLRPFSGADPSARGTEFRLELRVRRPGALGIESFVVAAEAKNIELGPLPVVAAGTAAETAAPGPGGGKASWRWVAPEWAYRYEAFKLGLEPVEGGMSITAAVPAVSFSPPAGASIEASGKLSWTAIAFDEGKLALPEARIGSGASIGRAEAASLEIRPLPPDFAGSRAIGSFSLSLAKEGSSGAAGEELRARLVLEGKGNFPALALPEPDIRLDGAVLPRASWTSRRVDEVEADDGGYRGRCSLLMEILPPGVGLLTLSYPRFSFLEPGSGPRLLDLPELKWKVLKAARGQGARASPDWGSGMEGASALWNRGEGGKALAFLYGRLRRAPPLSREAYDARKAAVSCSRILGTSPPFLDALPPPLYFAIAASLATLMGLALFILERRRARGVLGRRAPASSRGFAGSAILALALAFLSVASAAERRVEYAVVWADSLRTVPSALSELSIPVVQGSTARLRGRSGDYASVALADGVEGWVPLDSIFFY